MKRRKNALFAAFLSGLWGGKQKHLLDGPGMINDQPWKAVTLSYTDGSRLAVGQGDFAFLLTGEVRDANGEYAIGEGIEISTADLQFLKKLQLHKLSDADGDGKTTLVLTYMDGTQQKKAISSDTAIAIYNRFLPYFTCN